MKTTKKIWAIALALTCSLATSLQAQNIYVTSYGDGTIGEYGPGGSTINSSLVSGLNGPQGIAISGNDLLNQNTGYNRTGSANILTQERYTTIKRYFMLSLVWDFNHVGGGTPKK